MKPGRKSQGAWAEGGRGPQGETSPNGPASHCWPQDAVTSEEVTETSEGSEGTWVLESVSPQIPH